MSWSFGTCHLVLVRLQICKLRLASCMVFNPVQSSDIPHIPLNTPSTPGAVRRRSPNVENEATPMWRPCRCDMYQARLAATARAALNGIYLQPSLCCMQQATLRCRSIAGYASVDNWHYDAVVYIRLVSISPSASLTGRYPSPPAVPLGRDGDTGHGFQESRQNCRG